MEPLYPLTPRDAAELLGVSSEEVRKLCKAGLLKHARPTLSGTHFRLRHDDVVAFLESRSAQESKPVAEAPKPVRRAPKRLAMLERFGLKG